MRVCNSRLKASITQVRVVCVVFLGECSYDLEETFTWCRLYLGCNIQANSVSLLLQTNKWSTTSPYLIIIILCIKKRHQESSSFTWRGVLIKHASLDYLQQRHKLSHLLLFRIYSSVFTTDLLVHIKLVSGSSKDLLFHTVHCHQPQNTNFILLADTMSTILGLEILITQVKITTIARFFCFMSLMRGIVRTSTCKSKNVL